jgi:hypothetical protein
MRSSSLKSLRLASSYIVGAVMLTVFGYGVVHFIDGAVHECGSSYCSSRGQHPKTAEDYDTYKAWEKTILIVWPLGVAALYFLGSDKQEPGNPD